MRNEFEKLCETNKEMSLYLAVCHFNEVENCYENNTGDYDLHYYADKLNGAWWCYQQCNLKNGFSQGGYTGNSWDDLKDNKNWTKVGNPVGTVHGSEAQVSVKQYQDPKTLELINSIHGVNCNVTIVENEKEDLE